MTPYDWTGGGSVDVFLNEEYGFTSMSRYHSTEWVWNLRTKYVVLLQESEMTTGYHYRGLMLGI